jgi:phage FluMu protein Com
MNDKITIQCPACNAKLAVASQHAGKKLKCPKCGTASVVSVGSQLRRTEPPAIPVQDSGTGKSVVPAQRPLIIGGIATGLVLMLVVMIGIWTNLNDAEQQTASEPPVDIAAAEEPTDDIAPADVQPLVEQPEPEPNIPDPKEQLKEAFTKLDAELNDARRKVEEHPVRKQLILLKQEIELRNGTADDHERRLNEAEKLLAELQLLNTKCELTAAKAVKMYVFSLEQMGIPEETAEEYEQEVVSKTIQHIQDPSGPDGIALQRFRDGGPSVLQSRVGRMWVLYGIRLTL